MQHFNTKVNNSWSKCYHVNISNNANRQADWMLRLIQNRIMQVYWNSTLCIQEEIFFNRNCITQLALDTALWTWNARALHVQSWQLQPLSRTGQACPRHPSQQETTNRWRVPCAGTDASGSKHVPRRRSPAADWDPMTTDNPDCGWSWLTAEIPLVPWSLVPAMHNLPSNSLAPVTDVYKNYKNKFANTF